MGTTQLKTIVIFVVYMLAYFLAAGGMSRKCYAQNLCTMCVVKPTYANVERTSVPRATRDVTF
jgi:hypothetical protein